MPNDAIAVLIVEDDTDDFVIARDLLGSSEEPRFALTRADTLQNGLAALGKGEFDVVLLDITLPDCQGWETFERVIARAQGVPVVLLTGMADEQLGVRAIKQGAQDYLVKGRFGADQLARAIRYAIERHRAESSLKRYRDHLEVLVESRTAEAHTVNQRLLHEIQERQRVEESMRAANVRLSDALTELKRTQQQIIQHERLSALGQMAGGIMHDFNNALMPILGYTELMIDTPAILDDREDTVGILREIHGAARVATDVLHRMRYFHQSDADELPAAVDLNGMIEAVITFTRPKWAEELRARGVRIEMHKELGAAAPVRGRPVALREALTNIVLNAIDAMPQGGRLTVRTRQDAGWVDIEVADTGVGMSPEVQARCLEPFFTTRGPLGTGLGLPSAYGIVRSHGGELAIASREGRGTTVTLRLPAMKREDVAAQAPPAGPDRPLAILVVDDERETCRLLNRFLGAAGHRVAVAHTGAEALQAFAAGAFDVVITDRAMPDMSGDAVAAAVKRARAETPVIMLTGFGDLIIDRGELPPGVNRVLGKPVRLETLHQAIGEMTRAAAPR